MKTQGQRDLSVWFSLNTTNQPLTLCTAGKSAQKQRSLSELNTEQREGVASVAELLRVVHPFDDGTAALPGVREVVCTA